MKKHVFNHSFLQVLIPVFVFLTMCNYTNAQVKVKSDGKVGIGILNPDAQFQVHGNLTKFSFPTIGSYSPTSLIIDRYYGASRFYPYSDNKGELGLISKYWLRSYIQTGYFDDVYAIQYHWNSDAKVKKNITPLKNSLENVLKLNPCQYDFDFSNPDSEHLRNLDPEKYTNKFGFIAQELQEIYPDLVEFDTTTQLLNIDYIGLIAILTAAIQEQDEKIQKLEKELGMSVGDTKSTEAEADILQSQQAAVLGKNKPNPFNENTSIEYYLPSTVQSAVLNVYDLQGKQLKSIRVTEYEYGNITIQGSELRPGMYHYSLIADGQVVGIEKMILTE